MQISIMNLKRFWERHKPQRWPVTAAPLTKTTTPKPFKPLTHQESLAILENTIQWLMDEATDILLMPDGGCKERRTAELCARDKSVARDLRRLIRKHQA